MPGPENSPTTETPAQKTTPGRAELAPEDYYFDGPLLVFTAAYHLKRGSCCNSGCRHCPWREPAD